MRYFKLLNQSCIYFGNDAGFSIASVENDGPDGLNFNIRTLKGMDITRDGVLALLRKHYKRELKIALSKVNNSLKYRKMKKIIKEGTSGVKDLYLSTLEEISDRVCYRRTKHILNITCADKIRSMKVYLPDLVVFLPDIIEEDDDFDRIKITELKQIDVSKYKSFSVEDTKIVDNYIGEYEFAYIEGIHPDDEEKKTYTWEMSPCLAEKLIELLESDTKPKGKIKAIVDTCYGEREVIVENLIFTKNYQEHRQVLDFKVAEHEIIQ
jgi:hypothetical protein